MRTTRESLRLRTHQNTLNAKASSPSASQSPTDHRRSLLDPDPDDPDPDPDPNPDPNAAPSAVEAP